ncbi:MAG TPA: outer membrane beta-barrel protein [Gammaproteobacteria bacterium]|nr:outer membrane beta-barrel protein [Gammaproteobacteria bacterium]
MQLKHILLGTAVTLTGSFLFTAPAYADSYVGGGIGYYRLESNDFLTSDEDFKDNRTAYKVYAGGTFGEIFGMELSYIDFGDAEDSGFTVAVDGYTIAATAGSPASGNFRFYGKIGQLFWESEFGSDDSVIEGGDFDGNDTFYGVGMRYAMTQGIGMRVEYETYNLDQLDIDMPSVSLHVAF